MLDKNLLKLLETDDPIDLKKMPFTDTLIFESNRPRTKEELAAIALAKKRKEQQAADNANRDRDNAITSYQRRAMDMLQSKDLSIDLSEWISNKKIIIVKKNDRPVDHERYDRIFGTGHNELVAYQKNIGWYEIEMNHIFGNGKRGRFLGGSLPSRFGFREDVIRYIELDEWDE